MLYSGTRKTEITIKRIKPCLIYQNWTEKCQEWRTPWPQQSISNYIHICNIKCIYWINAFVWIYAYILHLLHNVSIVLINTNLLMTWSELYYITKICIQRRVQLWRFECSFWKERFLVSEEKKSFCSLFPWISALDEERTQFWISNVLRSKNVLDRDTYWVQNFVS